MSSQHPSPPHAASVIPLESALIERARRGDGGAFREIFRQHAPRVWRFLRDLLGGSAAADEATQETFVRAHAALTSGVAVERLCPWLLGVARNVSREHQRARAGLVGGVVGAVAVEGQVAVRGDVQVFRRELSREL